MHCKKEEEEKEVVVVKVMVKAMGGEQEGVLMMLMMCGVPPSHCLQQQCFVFDLIINVFRCISYNIAPPVQFAWNASWLGGPLDGISLPSEMFAPSLMTGGASLPILPSVLNTGTLLSLTPIWPRLWLQR